MEETTPVNPTLYDVLGVPRDATADEIRKAWREAADRFEPGSGGSVRQFRLFNEAAEVLLDPERRKQYDDTLPPEEPAPVDEGTATGAADEGAATGAADEGAATGASDAPVTVPGPPMPGSARATGVTTASGTPDRVAEVAPDDAPRDSGRQVPWWVLAVLGLVTAVAVGLAVYFVNEARQEQAYQEALDRAPAAAESAAAAVLSYDYETLEADRDAAAKFLSDGYRQDYLDTFELVMESAPQTKAKVEAQVLASSAMLGGGDRDPDRVPVLLFVNQTTVSSASSGEPSVALNRVRLDMVNVDGAWLVDGITSY